MNDKLIYVFLGIIVGGAIVWFFFRPHSRVDIIRNKEGKAIALVRR